jgi:7,8-dihydropterin-6-yl-methyl-4-(beta-D-ribofuranosyl)aminobenzene 5'-phosphate synthase
LRIKVVYDNEANPGFEKAWGVSCLIELGAEKVLFDTGWDGGKLLANLDRLGEDPADVSRIILSHQHWDHIGGINHMPGRGAELWVPASFSKNLKGDLSQRFALREVGDPVKIREGVWTTGELGRRVKEQSLVVETPRGLVVVVGCSHPGVKEILDVASKFGRVYAIIGGMHGFSDYAVLKGMGLIVPLHCTANKRRILKIYPDSAVEGRAGSVFDLGPGPA